MGGLGRHVAKKKTNYCPHEPHTHVYRPSKSSRMICCSECYLKFIRQGIVDSSGEEFAEHLDWVNSSDLSLAFPKWEYKP